MEKHVLSSLFRVVACSGFSFFLSFVADAQTANLDPSRWESLVESEQNVSILDTFLMQTFGDSPDNNWGYTLVRNAELFNAQEFGIKNASGGQCLRLKAGAEVRFDEWAMTPRYNETWIYAPYAVQHVMKGENLSIWAKWKENEQEKAKQWTTIMEDDYSSGFQEVKKYALNPVSGVYTASRYMSRVHFLVSDSSENPQGGYYVLDSAYIFRKIPAFSLFTGEGNWQDTVHWSHYAATRGRQALVKGNVTAAGNHRCRALLLGAGSVQIPAMSRLAVGQLWLNGPAVSVQAAGELVVDKQVSWRITFPETGQWYFVSFPFDVYAAGLDTEFGLQDESQTGSGNFFYLKQYDGAARSRSNRTTGNWKTIYASATAGSEPVMRKGAGYLISLDRGATRREMTFSVSADLLPAGFGREGSIAVQVSLPADGLTNEHHGWVLCGNPLPSPVPLSAIGSTSELDGYAYLYEAGTFKPYAFGSEKVLPPLSAFFVKARQATTLVVQQPENYYKSLPAFSSLMHYEGNEPEEVSSPTNLFPVSAYRYELSEEGLRVIGLPASGYLSIVDLSGQVVLRRPFSGGDTFVPLTLQAGNYILSLENGSDRTQYKFGWNN